MQKPNTKTAPILKWQICHILNRLHGSIGNSLCWDQFSFLFPTNLCLDFVGNTTRRQMLCTMNRSLKPEKLSSKVIESKVNQFCSGVRKNGEKGRNVASIAFILAKHIDLMARKICPDFAWMNETYISRSLPTKWKSYWTGMVRDIILNYKCRKNSIKVGDVCVVSCME